MANNHYVPQVYLKNFVDPKHRKVWVTENPYECIGTQLRATSRTGYVADLYEPDVEARLGTYETPARAVLDHLIARRPIEDEQQLRHLCKFLISIVARAPGHLDASERLARQKLPEVKAQARRRMTSEEYRREVEGRSDDELIYPVVQDCIRRQVEDGPLVEQLGSLNRTLFIMGPAENSELWTTDSPMLVNPGSVNKETEIVLASIALDPVTLLVFHADQVPQERLEYLASEHNRLLIVEAKQRPHFIYSSRRVEDGVFLEKVDVLHGHLMVGRPSRPVGTSLCESGGSASTAETA